MEQATNLFSSATYGLLAKWHSQKIHEDAERRNLITENIGCVPKTTPVIGFDELFVVDG